MQLFYYPSITNKDNSFAFDKEESKHIIRVLRKKEGDTLYVTNGLGELFTTKISIASDSKCTVDIVSIKTINNSSYQLHIAVAPTKMNERYEWFLEKATEIGVHEITPIICEHSERKVIKTERFEKILIAAMKQSKQCFLPKLNPAISFSEFIEQNHNGQKYIAHCEEMDKKSLKSQLIPNKNILVLIGPEGDFSVKEIETALQFNFIPVTLGNTRLRTETAAIVACHSVAFVNE